jgi:hypothetical protein
LKEYNKNTNINNMNYESSMEFILNYIDKHYNKDELLHNFSDLYLFVVNKHSELLLNNNELLWRYIMNDLQY